MPGVADYVSPGHVPDEYVVSDPDADGYNEPHVDLHNATSDAIDFVAGAVPSEVEDLTDVDFSTVPTGTQIVLVRDPGDGKIKLAVNSANVDLDLDDIPFFISWDEDASAWPLRSTVTDNTNRRGFWISNVAGVDPPPKGGGWAIDGKDVVIIPNADDD